MYWQVRLYDKSKDYPRFFWREATTDTLETWRMTCDSFGVKCAGFLAIIALHVCVDKTMILAAQRALANMYVDDMLGGANGVKAAISAIKDIIGQ